MDEPVCPCCPDAPKRIAKPKPRVAELTRKLGEARRAGNRQTAPFGNGAPKPTSKIPARKSGDAHGTHRHRPPPPGSVTECHQAPLLAVGRRPRAVPGSPTLAHHLYLYRHPTNRLTV